MAVDVQELTNAYGQGVGRARAETLLEFREFLADEIAAHPEQREQFLSMVLRQLRERREEYRDAGDAAMEDFVLDAMDLVTGWVARDVRL